MDSETVEEIKRHFGVVVEGLRSDMRVIAEGQDVLREGLERLDNRMETRFERVETRLDRVDIRLDRVDVRLEHVENGLGSLNRKVEGLTDVVQRVHSELTGRLNDHDQRLTALERKAAKGR